MGEPGRVSLPGHPTLPRLWIPREFPNVAQPGSPAQTVINSLVELTVFE